MATTRVTIEGVSELGERMRSLSVDVALKVARAATNAAAQEIKKRAKAKIQTNSSKNQTSVDTGSLLNAVVVKRSSKRESSLTSEHVVAVRKRKTGKKTKTRQASAPHATFIEFGTVRAPPEPFMRPAFDEGKEDAAEKMIDVLQKRLGKVGA